MCRVNGRRRPAFWLPYGLPMRTATPTLSLSRAVRLAIHAQKLGGSKPHLTSISDVTSSLGAIQLDTISALARSHELVAYARIPHISREDVEAGYWSPSDKPASHFEYWSHAASIIPLTDWPLFGFRRQLYRERGKRWHDVHSAVIKEVKARLHDAGNLTTSELGGGRKSSYWWDWSDNKIAIEYLLDVGEVVVTRREKWKRTYALTSDVIPSQLLQDLPTTDALETLLHRSLRTLGIGTRGDILDVHRLRASENLKTSLSEAWQRFIGDPEVVQVQVADWVEPAWTYRDLLDSRQRLSTKRTVLLSPFDSLVWHRPRTQRLFDMDYKLEAYTPEPKRIYGYFAMPVLVGDRLVARVDPGRAGRTLVAKRVTLQPQCTSDDVMGIAQALREAASWVGCDAIKVEDVRPRTYASMLRQLTAG
jgi:uncharacterized protein YcaQ